MNQCSKSDIVNHKIAFSDYAIQTVTISTPASAARADHVQPFGYYRADGTRDVNSGWRVTSGNMYSDYWVRVITLDELTEWESN